MDTQFDGPFLGVSGIHLTMAGLVDSARLQDNLQLLKDVEAVAFRSGQSESDQTPTAQAKSQTSLDAARGKVGWWCKMKLSLKVGETESQSI